MNSTHSGRIVLYAALIFLAGFVTGAFLAPLIGHSSMRPPRPDQISQHMLARLRSGLHLTDDQLTKIKPLVEKLGGELEVVRRETTEHVMERIAETNAQISALLTPEQKAEFIKMEAEHRKHFRHDHPFAEPPGPPLPQPESR